MEDEYGSAQQAFLVGRYLKENGLSETLECFLRETPIKMVPKMQEDMQSLPQIIRELRQLSKDREELKESRRRMQQYEEILNLLFEELRDVYNFQSPAVNSAFTSADNHNAISTPSMFINESEMTSTTPERQFVTTDFSADDAQLIESFCRQNLNNHSASGSGRMIPVVLPKESNMISSKGLHKDLYNKEPCSSHGASGSPSDRAEGQPIHSRAQMLEHHYNRIREHRRINRRSKHRFLDKPIPPLSSFVAYSSLPLSSSKGYTSSCGHNSRHAIINTNTQKQSRSKKLVDADESCVAEPHEHNNRSACTGLQAASCFGKDALCLGNQPDQVGSQIENDNIDVDGDATVPEAKLSSFMKFDQKLETANLLERLLPLVADPDTMQSFISNLDTRSPHPSPRDHRTCNHWYLRHLHTQPEKAGTSRPQGIEEQPLTQHDSENDESLEDSNNVNDDASVLAELEEAVGRTVDDILRRHILISPAPAPASASSPPLPPSPSPPQSVDMH